MAGRDVRPAGVIRIIVKRATKEAEREKIAMKSVVEAVVERKVAEAIMERKVIATERKVIAAKRKVIATKGSAA
jgi:hypothetical protein